MKTKTIFLSLFLMLASVGAWAQEKYEYAVLKVNDLKRIFFIQEEKTETINTTSETLDRDLIKKLNELSTQDWEVYNSTVGSATVYIAYYLRRKKN